ncbi:hypothetical protein [Actinomadura rudentiformis]|uniref:Uncharacterized protein n=1 Tax=Actinomadura rudentiformis TaxID=359158 RepID=A0A6H9YZ54_9ACTN|nr:hypothetical protein [Actinomadura rudentiformis]KAB2347313.1 hypothetical protein F8566_20080 [Actinomadura rudentiformis]
MSAEPCVHYSAARKRHCGHTPTNLFIQGRRCSQHTPCALAGMPEPSPAPVLPTTVPRSDIARPYGWQAVMFIHAWNESARQRAGKRSA